MPLPVKMALLHGALPAVIALWTIALFVRGKFAHAIISAAIGFAMMAGLWNERWWALLIGFGVWLAVVVVLETVGPADEGIRRFARESYVETWHKSAWPTWMELRQFTTVVIFAVLVVAIWIGGLDYILGKFTEMIAGGRMAR